VPGLISDSNAAIISGKRIATTQLSSRYKVFVTPTILFLDGGGSELAERMIGINTP
jgi:thioredoxin-related protein